MADPILPGLLGTWKIVSAVREEVPSGARTDLFGANPVGFLNYSPDQRMMTVIVRSDRKRPAGHPIGNDDAVHLFRSLMNYAGTFEVRENEVFHYVDVSANEIWTGTEQQRFYKIEGDRLALTSPVNHDPIDGKVSVRSMIWAKLK
ncbi:MAG: lipocalin-like domain-containing protein [Xanthobacteraceae bacterium]